MLDESAAQIDLQVVNLLHPDGDLLGRSLVDFSL
jgi:hypothetical protein